MLKHPLAASGGRKRLSSAYSILALMLLATMAATGAAAQECPCIDPVSPNFDPRLLWRGDDVISAEDIILMGAPVLWYTADEPLKLVGEDPFPHAHPCDEPSDIGVVYYQIQRIQRRHETERVTVPEQEDPEFFVKTGFFTVRYYFYYRRDMGMNPHEHDLEVTEIEFSLQIPEESGGCYEVRMERVTAFAHGTDWYNNELVVGDGTKYPITLFVEEGKHATCPDRNSDGVYTPGYDVNVRVSDAWGCRDVFGSGFLISASYQGSMFKPRAAIDKVLPPESPLLCRHPMTYSQQSWKDFVEDILKVEYERPRYELRAANKITLCDADIAHKDFLADMMKRHRFGQEYEADQYKAQTLSALAQPVKGTTGIIPSINLRWDQGLGLSFALRGREVLVTYIVPRFTWIAETDNISIEALFSESASRFMGTYVSVGAAYELERVRNPDTGNIVDGDSHVWDFVTEIGIKFRFRLTGKARALVLGNSFGGVRFGARVSGFDHLFNARLIAEIGAGVW